MVRHFLLIIVFMVSHSSKSAPRSLILLLLSITLVPMVISDVSVLSSCFHDPIIINYVLALFIFNLFSSIHDLIQFVALVKSVMVFATSSLELPGNDLFKAWSSAYPWILILGCTVSCIVLVHA